MKKTINLFIDMDGTVAQFYHDKKCLEKMYEQGYFENLPLYAMAKHIDEFAKKDTCVNVYILSACVNSKYCEQEKVEWLLKYMPNISPTHFIFTKVGENKVLKAKTIVSIVAALPYINVDGISGTKLKVFGIILFQLFKVFVFQRIINSLGTEVRFSYPLWVISAISSILTPNFSGM